ncbi:hypothetical protein DTL42_19565 [Bremerella cremea]|uniref:Uncharacterized protein n=1 Tax=Bremerella cremea TaxID=1031537 RepID=A0A368KM30_9BACT|nr:hypothetical protein DTL42_19565 [Bremerella cremea]
MFNQTETLFLFGLTTAQAILISEVIQRYAGWPLVLAFPAGCILGFFLSSVQLTVFYQLFKGNDE